MQFQKLKTFVKPSAKGKKGGVIPPDAQVNSLTLIIFLTKFIFLQLVNIKRAAKGMGKATDTRGKEVKYLQ